MFDTMTTTKILGSFFGALLFFLLVGWASSSMYATSAGGHGGEHVQGYIIAQAEEDGGEDGHGDAAVEEAPVEEVLVGDATAGEKVFKKCKACHKLEEGVKAVGPDLFGVVGRDVASREGFSYSNPMLEQGGSWDEARLNTFLTDPKGMVPGTKMSFRGLAKPADRANVIAYLLSVAGG